MKKRTIIRLTESELMNVITEAVNRCISEDVLGDNFKQNGGNQIENNYEAFNDQGKDDDGSHDWSGVGEQDDPTVYENKHTRRLIKESVPDYVFDAIQYIKDNKSWDDWIENRVLDAIDHGRRSLESVYPEISDEIRDMLEEFGEEHDLPENWWSEYGDLTDFFMQS